MNRTSTLSLLLGLTGVALAGCSSPDEGGGIPPAPTVAPDFASNPSGQAGTGQTVNEPLNPAGGAGGQAGTTNDVVPGAMAGSAGMGGSAMGAAGTTGMGTGVIPVGSGTVIVPGPDGWVAGSSNQFGIQGSFHEYSDNASGGTTTIAAPTVTEGRVCVSGEAAAVPDADSYGTHWGGGLGLNLADPGNMTGPGPWDRGSVIGFTFDVTGTQIPPAAQLRFNASPVLNGVATPNYCMSGVTMGANRVEFTDIRLNCFNAGGGTDPVPDTAPLENIQWQVATVLMTPTPFDFCIENLTPITQ